MRSLPLWECGLKYFVGSLIGVRCQVTPLAGVWIEIAALLKKTLKALVTPLAGVWIEIKQRPADHTGGTVTPLAGVWIEISLIVPCFNLLIGHSPCGSVD